MKAIETAGFKPWKEVMIALDVAASEFYDSEKQVYRLRVDNKMDELSSGDLVSYYDILLRKYPIISIEDGHHEDDWEGWKKMMESTGKTIQLVGDDLLVTNVKRLQKAIDENICNSILIKLNQIGTVTETKETIELAKKNNYSTIISHRSGETEDNFIAGLACETNAGQIKTGSMARSERLSKYNELIRIDETYDAAYVGKEVFDFLK